MGFVSTGKRGFTLIELLGSIAILTLVCSLLCGACSFFGGGFSEGERAGVITKFSRKGIFIKSWEGELLMGGLGQDVDGNITSNVFYFSVDDDETEVIQAIQDSLRTGNRCSLRYDESLIRPIFSADTSYSVKKVVDPNKEAQKE